MLRHRQRAQEQRSPAVRVLGVGMIGGMLAESLGRFGIGTDGAFTRVSPSAVDEAATGRNVTVPTIIPALSYFTGMDFVVILASPGEPEALRILGDVARVARAAGALVFAMLAQPPLPPGESVRALAAEIADCTDALIFVPTEPPTSVLLHLLDAYVAAAFVRVPDSFRPSAPVGADFLDVRRTFIDAGEASTGVGLATGPDRALHAAERAIDQAGSARLATARGLLILVAGGCSLRLREVTSAVYAVHDAASHDTTVTLGAHYDERLGETVRVTLIVAERALVQMPVSFSNGRCFLDAGHITPSNNNL
jgi:cell division protein FtsZ